MTRTHERDLEALIKRTYDEDAANQLPLVSQCGCNQVQIPLLYDTLIGMRILLREMRDSLEYLVIIADGLKELKDEQMQALRGCGCCHLHGTPECGHHDETRSTEPSPADAGSHVSRYCPECNRGVCRDCEDHPEHGGRDSGATNNAEKTGRSTPNTGLSASLGDEKRLLGSHRSPAERARTAANTAMPQSDYYCSWCGGPKESNEPDCGSPPKAESAAAQREGGLCTLCNDGVWKGERHFERSEKHIKASP